jgi:transposase
LVNHRANLIAERNRLAKRVRWQLHDIAPGLEPAGRTLSQLGTIKTVDRRLARLEATIQIRICREQLTRLRELTKRINELRKELAPLVHRIAPGLLQITGCGTIVAARIIAEVANIARFKTDAQLALYAGCAPLDASSGKQQRHRLNRTGNRKLNHAIHVIAITQARIYAPAKEYLARRKADGKSTKEALRAFKRLLIRRVFALLKAQARATQTMVIDAHSQTPCLT